MLAKFDALVTEQERTQLEQLRKSQPGLAVRHVDNVAVVVAGRLGLVAADGSEVDAYVVEVAIPRDFPSRPPRVVESGDRIPRIADRHINESDGSCCIELPVEFFLRAPQTIAGYVGGPVCSYFIAQSYFEANRTWPHGQRRHGSAGVKEFCHERLGTADTVLVARMLQMLPHWKRAKHDGCPCGSGKKSFKCHRDAFAVLRGWPQTARDELVRLIGPRGRRR